MGDLLVCVPSRGRPDRLGTMLDASLSLSEAATDIAAGIDDDDRKLDGYEALRPRDRVMWQISPQRSVADWTNHLAQSGCGKYRAFCSMSDDHLPRTPGWDRLLLEAIDAMGGTGIAYGDDLLQGPVVPTAAVVSSDIVAALGWLALPLCKHYWIDNAWKALGEGAGCLAYCPEVVIEHLHPGASKALWDETYAVEAAYGREDEIAYEGWRDSGRMAADIATVAALRAAKVPS